MIRRRTALLAAALAPAAFGQTYPSRPVRLIVPYPGGGTTDVLARPLAQKMQEAWGQSVVVDNRPGASGVVGADLVARAAPDGHTLLVTTQQTQTANGLLIPNIPYDVERGFTPITLLAIASHALVVPASSPARDVAGLIALARSKALSFASSSAGSASHLLGETFNRVAQLNAQHIPYRGAGPATTDLIAGTVDFMFATWSGVSGLVREGRLRLIAAGGDARFPGFPDVPTMAELGYPDLGADAWFALYGPPALPRPIVDRIHAVTVQTFAEPALRERLEGAGYRVRTMGVDEFSQFHAAEVRRWFTIVRTAGVRIED